MIRKLLTLTLIIVATIISLPQNQAKAESVVTIKDSIVKHSIELGIDPALGLSIAKQESGFCHNKRSAHGAVGVFQLMPQTARKIGYDPYALNDNIKGGLMYYKMMFKMFGSVELALAAYNAGPGNVKRYKGVPPFSETKRFVSSIMNEYQCQKRNPDPSISKYKATVGVRSSSYRQHLDNDYVLTNFLLNQAI